MCIQGHSAVECERKCDSDLQLQIPSLEQLPSTLDEHASPCASFCVDTIPQLHAGRNTSEHQWNQAGLALKTSPCWDFLKAFQHPGNKLTVQTEVPVLWQLGNPTHSPTAAAPSWRLSSGTTTLPPDPWAPQRGSPRNWAVFGMWMGTGVMEGLSNPAVQALGQGRERLGADK